MNYCSKCGMQILDDAAFCTNCGAPIMSENQETSVLEDVYSEPKQAGPFESNANVENVNPAFVNPTNFVDDSVNRSAVQEMFVPPAQKSNYNANANSTTTQIPHAEYSHMETQTTEKPNMKSCFIQYWQSTAHFEGRSRRSELWYAVLMNFLITLIGSISVIASPFAVLYGITTIAPTISVIIRRLHDIGKEWYNIFFILIPLAGPIILLVWMCTDGEAERNQFGDNPKAVE